MKNNKSLGQHWLKDRLVLDEIAALAASNQTGLCIEIGPGLGTLTSSLLRRFNKVIAIEFDENLAHNLPKSFPGKNLEVIHADILDYDNFPAAEPYIVAGNIPYYITSPIIEKLLHLNPAPSRIVLLIQKEVAERIVAKSGHHSLLSLSVENRALATLGPIVKRELFTPPPKVDSQVVILEPFATNPNLGRSILTDDDFNLIKLGFSAPRKKLLGNLSSALHLEREQLITIFTAAHLHPNVRPADLTLTDWQNLIASIRQNVL